MRAMTGGAAEKSANPPAVEPKKPAGAEDAALSLAYEAMQEKDEPSFKRAMRTAIRACMQEYGPAAKE